MSYCAGIIEEDVTKVSKLSQKNAQ